MNQFTVLKYEQQLSATNSALVNDAYRTLKDPIRRIDMLVICSFFMSV